MFSFFSFFAIIASATFTEAETQTESFVLDLQIEYEMPENAPLGVNQSSHLIRLATLDQLSLEYPTYNFLHSVIRDETPPTRRLEDFPNFLILLAITGECNGCASDAALSDQVTTGDRRLQNEITIPNDFRNGVQDEVDTVMPSIHISSISVADATDSDSSA